MNDTDKKCTRFETIAFAWITGKISLVEALVMWEKEKKVTPRVETER